MKNLIGLIVLAPVVFLAACAQNTDPALTTPAPKPIPKIDYQTVSQSVKGDSVKVDNRLDILFIIDNSDSMRGHMENLGRNLQKFVDRFASSNSIDFHIGYTLVHDRIRYKPADVPAVCGPETSAPGRLNWENPGTLKQFTHTVSGKRVPMEQFANRRYLTAADANFRDILADNLDPRKNPDIVTAYVNSTKGTLDKSDPQHRMICNQGPENEESITPLLAALTDPTVTDFANKGFRRPGAFFVAIIVSDAKDDSVQYGPQFQPDNVANKIKEITGDTAERRRMRVFSVVISTDTLINARGGGNCEPDPAFAAGSHKDKFGNTILDWGQKMPRKIQPNENPLEILAHETEDKGAGKFNQTLSICAPDFGSTLARYGSQLQSDALRDQIIPLKNGPRQELPASDPKAMHVYVGSDPATRIELKEGVDWAYLPYPERIKINSTQIQWNKLPSHEITYTYTPVDTTSKNAHVVQ